MTDYVELKKLAEAARNAINPQTVLELCAAVKSFAADGSRLTAQNASLKAELEAVKADKAILDEALSTVCDERDEAYDQNSQLQKDIDEITSANSDLAGWSKAKDEQIQSLRTALQEAREALEQDLQSIVDAYQEGFNDAFLALRGKAADVTEWQHLFAQSGASNYVAARNQNRRACEAQGG